MGKRLLTPQERRQRHRQQMTDDILGIARAIMRERGAAALSLHEIARRMGIKTPSLYAYFPSKAALYDALYRLGVRLFRERMERAMSQNTPLWDRFHATIEAYMAFAQTNPELYQIIFDSAVLGYEPSGESRAASEAAWEALRAGFGRMIGSAEIDPGLPAEAAQDLMMALTHGLTALHMAHEPYLPLGRGRFGRLIPAAVEVFQTAWQPHDREGPSKPSPSRTTDSPFVWDTS